MKTNWGAIVAIGACLSWTPWVAGQLVLVSGKVITPSDKGVEGVAVSLVSLPDVQNGLKSATATSDVNGNFRVTCDREEIVRAFQAGAVWEVRAEKRAYAPGRANLLLAPGKEPRAVTIVMLPSSGHDELMSKVDLCADKKSDFRTVYVFDFSNDSPTPRKFATFQQLLGFKLKNAVRTHLEAAGLLSASQLEIKTCGEAPVRDEADAVYAASRLGCSGVISGYIEEQAGQMKSVVRFTALDEPPLLDFAPVSFSSDVAQLIRPGEEIDSSYLAFAAFALGRLYLTDGRSEMAVKCFQHAKSLRPGSVVAERSEGLLTRLAQTNPAKSLRPIGATSP